MLYSINANFASGITFGGRSKAIHMVGAWTNENKLSLGQVKVDEKSNEITAILVNEVYAIIGLT